MQRAYADQRDGTKRRDVLCWAGTLLRGGSSARPAKSARKNEAAFAGLSEKDPMDVEMSCAEVIEKAHRLGHDYEARHGDCCRCTVAALQSAIKFVPNDKGLFLAASCVETFATASAEIARKPSGEGPGTEIWPHFTNWRLQPKYNRKARYLPIPKKSHIDKYFTIKLLGMIRYLYTVFNARCSSAYLPR